MPLVLPGTGTEVRPCAVSAGMASVRVMTREAASAGTVESMPDVLPGTGIELVLVWSVTTGASPRVMTREAASAGMVESMPESLPGTGTLLTDSGVPAAGAGIICAEATPPMRARAEMARAMVFIGRSNLERRVSVSVIEPT